MKNWVKMIFLLMLMAVLFNAGCGNSKAGQEELKNKLAAYGDEEILISGLEGQDFSISVKDLMDLDTVTKSAVSNRANGEQVKVKVTGPLLDTFLKKYGKSQQDFSLIRFSARDRYSIAVPADILRNRDIILAFMDQGEPLVEADRPVRVIIPGERAMYWVRMLNRIDFETGETAELCKKIIFLDTAAKSLPQEDYQYYESRDKIIKTRDLIGKYADINDSTVKSVFMVAGDGLKKDEKAENFLKGNLKITGADMPRFLSPELPQGMHVMDLLHINYGTTVFFSMDQAVKVLPQVTSGETGGVAFTDIVKRTGTGDAYRYRFTSADGTGMELDITEMTDAVVCLDSQGNVAFHSGAPGNKTIKDLISVEIVE
ncbi:MAG: molybdopterin-dependent oxidoreductase [Dehalobacterium sp.]